MASGLTRNQVPGNRLRVRIPCPPLQKKHGSQVVEWQQLAGRCCFQGSYLSLFCPCREPRHSAGQTCKLTAAAERAGRAGRDDAAIVITTNRTGNDFISTLLKNI